MIDDHKDDLIWDTCNETIDDISNSIIVFKKEGKDLSSDAVWNHKRTVYQNDKVEVTENTGEDGHGGYWKETWTKDGLKRWAEKIGMCEGQHWKEKWYKKVKRLSNKKDENGVIIPDEYESDGSEIEESTCEKWGKNEHT